MSKPEKLILGYIQLRGRALEEIFQYIRNSTGSSLDEVSGKFVVEKAGIESDDGSSRIKDYLNFLLSLGLITQGSGKEKDSYTPTKGLPTLDFKPLMLWSLKKAKDQSFCRLQDALVQSDLLELTPEELLKQAELGVDLEFTWTREKVVFFKNLAEFVGLASRYGTNLINRPTLDLVELLVRAFPGKGNVIPMKGFLDYVSKQFIPCYTRTGTVYKGLQWTLSSLNSHRFIEMKLESDSSKDFSPVQIGQKSYSFFKVRGSSR